MTAVEPSDVSRNSVEYAEIVAEILAETISKSAGKLECGESEEITPALMECLQYVYLHGPSSIRQIANGLEISLSAASQLVERLVKKNMVTRRDSDKDRRLTEVELMDAGREAVRQMRQRKSEWFARIFEEMPEEGRNAFREGVESFLKVALANQDDVDRACVRCGMVHVPFCVVHKVKSNRVAAQ